MTAPDPAAYARQDAAWPVIEWPDLGWDAEIREFCLWLNEQAAKAPAEWAPAPQRRKARDTWT